MANKFDLIITIVNKGYSDYVIDAAREAGASGGTVIYGLGTSKNSETFLGVAIHPEKEIILTVVKHNEKDKIMQTISERSNLNSNGHGICFSLPTSNVVGIANMLKDSDK